MNHDHPPSRRTFLRAAAACVGGTALSACGGGTAEAELSLEQPAGTTPPAPAPAPQPAPSPSPAPSPATPQPAPSPPPQPGSSGDVALALEGGGDGKPWTFGQIFMKGDYPDQVDAYAADGTLTAFQADVRNRWPDGSVKFAVLSGIGARQVRLRRVTTARSGSVALGAVQASVTFANVRDYADAPLAAGPVTVTMPDSGDAAKFGADPTRHVAGLVRRIDGPAMTEYHYYAPVPGDVHLTVWWYVRAYSNGAREVETVVHCSPWARTTSGSGRRKYDVSVRVGGEVTYTNAVDHWYRTMWARVDWVGSAPQIKPRHDARYLVATRIFPHQDWGAPDLGLPPANTFSEAMAPPVNNPDSILGWIPVGGHRFVGTSGTAGHVRSLWESAYAQGSDCYWSAEAHARVCGRWPLYVRDETTGRPFNVTRTGNTTLVDPAPVTGTTAGPRAAYTGTLGSARVSNTYSVSHGLPIGSGTYLLSGRYSFVEMMQMYANANAFRLQALIDRRSGMRLPGPLTYTSSTPGMRDGAWIAWSQMNVAAFSPESLGGAAPAGDDAELRTALVPYIEYYRTALDDAFVKGTTFNGGYRNELGLLSYSPSYLQNWYNEATLSAWSDNFQQNYIHFILHFGLYMGLPISAAAERATRDVLSFAAKRTIATMGGSYATTGWNWRYYFQDLPCGPVDRDGQYRNYPETWYQNWGEMFGVVMRGLALGATHASDADGLEHLRWTDGQGWIPMRSWHSSVVDGFSNRAQTLSTLALAVDRGEAGAAAAWAKYLASATMRHADTPANLKNWPHTNFSPMR
jgi:hypothetical protein